ncbi:MAG: tRNA pseudouridine(38-40) synthase TruA [Ignavibacteria bacterium]|nr:tRNA pseudouridine(38-40) synthase TruA [Ignavibacteria bacterium]
MGRFKLTIEYEGTRFNGWQFQKNQPTVQGKIMEACREVFNTDNFELYGAGRTDAGVHALFQVAHLDVKTMLAPHIIRMKINDLLPADICILNVEKVSSNFHARHDAVSRSYVYHISKRRTAFGKKLVWWIKDELDARKMGQAAELFEGMNDFRSFGNDDPDEKSTKVKIDKCHIYESETSILIHIVGSHFLWKMVRRMVGVLVEVGRGRITLDKVSLFLNKDSKEPAKYTAPPSGLYLEKVYYKGDKIEEEPLYVLNL